MKKSLPTIILIACAAVFVLGIIELFPDRLPACRKLHLAGHDHCHRILLSGRPWPHLDLMRCSPAEKSFAGDARRIKRCRHPLRQ